MPHETPQAAKLTRLLGIERPVLAAPMANIAGGRLASAVTAAGGLGMVAAGYGDLEWLDHEMAEVSVDTFGIGIITWKIMPTSFERILTYRPSAIWLSFGDPGPYIPLVHDAGAVAICQVASLAEASDAVAAGADVIVAQGIEAGGHGRLLTPVLDLVLSVSGAHPDIPIVAAGGMSDNQDLDTVLAAGGAGVALGTALYATHEALDADAAKLRLIAAGPNDTVVSTAYDHVRGPLWPEGYRGRSLTTAITRQWAGHEEDMTPHLDEIQTAYQQAVSTDDMELRVVWAGTGVDCVTEILPAATVIHRFEGIAGALA
jgi:nitronate monooxygenase